MGQSTDSLVLRKQILMQENNQYIKIARRDNILSEAQADSLQRINANTIEKPIDISLNILFQIRGSIDNKYEEQIKKISAPVLDGYYSAPHSMLPSKLGIPANYISPEEREAERQKIAMEQLAESMAMDFEKEELPKWQIWWHKHIRLFFGSMAWFKGEMTYVNGQEVYLPPGNHRK